jgi:hypothetical protein
MKIFTTVNCSGIITKISKYVNTFENFVVSPFFYYLIFSLTFVIAGQYHTVHGKLFFVLRLCEAISSSPLVKGTSPKNPPLVKGDIGGFEKEEITSTVHPVK